MRDLCNAFLTTKRNSLLTDELSERSFRDYHKTTDLSIAHFGRDRRVDDLRPDDFESLRRSISKRLGPVALRNTIARVRMVFKYAFDQRLVDQPVHYGQSFSRPSKRVLRRARQQNGLRWTPKPGHLDKVVSPPLGRHQSGDFDDEQESSSGGDRPESEGATAGEHLR